MCGSDVCLCICILVFYILRAKSSWMFLFCFFFQAEDGIRDLVRSRGLGDVYKRQVIRRAGNIEL